MPPKFPTKSSIQSGVAGRQQAGQLLEQLLAFVGRLVAELISGAGVDEIPMKSVAFRRISRNFG